MRSRTANSAAGLLIVLLMLVTCAKDKDEETYEDEEQGYTEAMYSLSPEELQALAISDWKKFRKESATLMNITERNLKTLNLKMVNASENNKIPLRNSYNLSYLEYTRLKDRYDRKNADFKDDLKDLKESTIKKNVLFKERFKKDITALNARLERIIDKSPQ